MNLKATSATTMQRRHRIEANTGTQSWGRSEIKS